MMSGGEVAPFEPDLAAVLRWLELTKMCSLVFFSLLYLISKPPPLSSTIGVSLTRYLEIVASSRRL